MRPCSSNFSISSLTKTFHNLTWRYYQDSPDHQIGSFWWKIALKLNSRGFVSISKKERSVATGTLPAWPVARRDITLLWLESWDNDPLRARSFALYASILVEAAETQEYLDLFYLRSLGKPSTRFRPLKTCLKTMLTPALRLLDLHLGISRIVVQEVLWVQVQCHSMNPHLCFIWKSRCVNKLKAFMWLLLNDRLNTKNMLVGETVPPARCEIAVLILQVPF
jgi:hypothetical protein